MAPSAGVREMIAMYDFLDSLGKYQLLNVLITYVCVPACLTLVVCFVNAACSPVPLQRKNLVRIYIGFAITRAIIGVVTDISGALSGILQPLLWQVVMWFGCGLRGRKDIVRWLQMASLVLISDLFSYLMILLYLPLDRLVPMWIGITTTPSALLTSCLPVILGNGVVALLFMFVRRRRWEHSLQLLIFLVASVAGYVAIILAFPADRSYGTTYQPNDVYHWTSIVQATIPLVSIGLVLILANIIMLYYQSREQAKENEVLLQELAKQQEMALTQRSYHHNIGNLLHGLEGLVDAGAPSYDTYHDAVVAQHRAANGEMLSSIQQLPSVSLKNLLLKKFSAFQSAQIPFYLFCDPLPFWLSMKEWDVCALMGVLIDNAFESAKNAAYPYVCMQVMETAGQIEILLRNTFAEAPDVSQLLKEGYTTKPSHEGLGLASVNKIMQKYPQAIFNVSISGQYFLAQLVAPAA